MRFDYLCFWLAAAFILVLNGVAHEAPARNIESAAMFVNTLLMVWHLKTTEKPKT